MLAFSSLLVPKIAAFPTGPGRTTMGMILEIRSTRQVLQAEAKGRFSLKEANRTYVDMLEAIAQNKARKVFFDGRALTGEPKFIERFYYGKFAADEVFKLLHRRACPVPQFAYVLKEPLLDPQKFGETVAQNRGMNVRTFDNLEDALVWLGIPLGNKPDADGV